MGIGGGEIKVFAPIGVNEYGASNKEASAGVLGGSDVQHNVTRVLDAERQLLLPLADGTPRSESCSRGASTFLLVTISTLLLATLAAYNYRLRDAARHGWSSVPHIRVITTTSAADNQQFVEFQAALRRSGVTNAQMDAKLRRDEGIDWKQLPHDANKVDYALKQGL